jgi:hypothetical protein
VLALNYARTTAAIGVDLDGGRRGAGSLRRSRRSSRRLTGDFERDTGC